MEFFVCLLIRVIVGVCHQFEGIQQCRAWETHLRDHNHTWRKRWVAALPSSWLCGL